MSGASDDWVRKLPGPMIRSWIWLRSWVFPPSVRFDSEFIEATRWAEGYSPQNPGEVYARVSKFAESQYQYMTSLSDGLDKKADDLLRFMTTIMGVVIAAGAGRLITFERPWAALLSLGPISLALIAAIRIRTPQSTTTPMNPRELLKIADLKSTPTAEQLESVLAASYHVAILGMKSLTSWKARMLNRSVLAFLTAFLLLLGSIIPL